jgi:hypothetical protein
MRTAETIALVQSANPIPLDPPAPPIEPLLARLDRSARTPESPLRATLRTGTRPSRIPRLGLAVAAIAALAIAITVVLAGRPSHGGPDIAAAIARAITPGPGVLHIVTETENTVAGAPARKTHEELWSAQSPRRLHTHSVLNTGSETIEDEGALLSVSPPRTLSWSASQPDTITESTQPVDATEQTPDAWLREAVNDHRAQVAGQVEIDGRHAWRLTISRPPTPHPQLLEGRELPAPTVLVDANTYDPLESVAYALSSTGGHPTLETITTRYLAYEELPATSANEAQLQLASHPAAKITPEPPAG